MNFTYNTSSGNWLKLSRIFKFVLPKNLRNFWRKEIKRFQVKMKPPPWSRRWDQLGPKGVEDVWTQQTAWFKRKFHKSWVRFSYLPLLWRFSTFRITFSLSKRAISEFSNIILHIFRKYWFQNTDFEKYDIIADYRIGSNLDYELQMEERMKRFEKERHEANLSKKRILKSVADAK